MAAPALSDRYLHVRGALVSKPKAAPVAIDINPAF